MNFAQTLTWIQSEYSLCIIEQADVYAHTIRAVMKYNIASY